MTSGSYEAYCLDEAVWYFGTMLEAELEKASAPRKKAKGQAAAEAARKRIIDRVLGPKGGSHGSGFMDPAVLMVQGE